LAGFSAASAVLTPTLASPLPLAVLTASLLTLACRVRYVNPVAFLLPQLLLLLQSLLLPLPLLTAGGRLNLGLHLGLPPGSLLLLRFCCAGRQNQPECDQDDDFSTAFLHGVSPQG
jgi:hypothetical protein